MMYQRNQQVNHNYNNNDDEFDSSESDSDSDAEVEENQADRENAALPANNNENNLPNNDEDDEAPNRILERIDYLGRNNDLPRDMVDANIADPVAFDENSRGNFELPLLDDGARCNDINLDIPPPAVNDDSSRESMDMDDDSGRPTLGNIVVERISDDIDEMNRQQERRNSDEEPLNNFFENDEYCSFMGNGDDMNNCKCSKCCPTSDPKKSSCDDIDCTDSNCCDKIRSCFKRRAIEDRLGNSSRNVVAGSSSASLFPKDCSSDDDDDIETTDKRSKINHCDNNRNNSVDAETGASTDDSLKENDDSNCGCANEGEMEVEERDVAEESASAVDNKVCTCFVNQLDHVNGHSSKMCLELPKTPCEKCASKIEDPAIEEKDSAEPSTSGNATASTSNSADTKDKAGPSNDQAVVAIASNNIRQRDNADIENARPSKRARLNNNNANKPKIPRTIFHKALDAVNMSWDNQHLKNILANSKYNADSSNAVHLPGSSSFATIIISALKSNFNAYGQPLWHEPLAMCAARIDSLRSHGHTDAALRLSISVVRTMKQIQRDGQLLWTRYQSVMNIQIEDEPTKPKTCCCDCNNGRNALSNSSNSTGSNNLKPNGQSGSSGSVAGGSSSANSHSSSSSNRHKRPYDSSRSNNGYSASGYMNALAPYKDPYKMYRYDYGHSTPYRYNGMGHDGCRRCLEARERANYSHGYHHSSNRLNIGGSGLPPPFFRSNFGQMHGGNMYDHRFGPGHYGGPAGYGSRYSSGSNYMPSVPHSNMCHGENCRLQHRSHGGVGNEPFGDLFGMQRASCSYEMDRYMGGGGPSGYNNMGGSHHCNPNGSRMRDLCGPSHVTRSSSQSNNQHNPHNPNNPHSCKIGENAPSTSASGGSSAGASSSANAGTSASSGDAEKSPTDAPQPGCSKDMDKPSSSSSEPPAKKLCTQHAKNQCCIKNYCCKMSTSANDKPKCCSTSNTSTSRNNFGLNVNKTFGHQSSCSSSTGNMFFSSGGLFNLPSNSRGHQQHLKDNENCCCNRPSTSTATSSSSSTNHGASSSASTSKSMPTSTTNPTTEFVRKQKQNCNANCLDCSIGCDIEFPLDAVACIFDCLTEACIIPDSINAPDMGRLSFDSVTAAAEDGSILPPRYQHVPIAHNTDQSETYLSLAFEAAILALGKQRTMPQGVYSQQVVCRQQDYLIQRLRAVDLDRLLVDVLKQLTTQLLDGGPSSGLGMSASLTVKINKNCLMKCFLFFFSRIFNSSGIYSDAYIGKIPICIASQSTH